MVEKILKKPDVRRNPYMYTYEELQEDIRSLRERYPEWMTFDSLADTWDGRKVYRIVIGKRNTGRKLFVNGGIHGREYITSQLVMEQAAVYLAHIAGGDSYKGRSYRRFWEASTVHLVPMVNPDGVSISQMGMEGIQTEEIRKKVREIARMDGERLEKSYLMRWKANGNGVDLNRNFDALWEQYHTLSEQPSSEGYKGERPGCEPESAALIRLTEREKFSATISYHTQGNVIYWYFGQQGRIFEETQKWGRRISFLTGYPMDGDYKSLDPAGYKDWAISKRGIPSLTIEVGEGISPVPAEQFEMIWKRNGFVWEETLLAMGELLKKI